MGVGLALTTLWSPSAPLAHFALRAVVVYVAVLALLRVSGKKQVGQMGAGDFVALLLISNAVQNAMNAGDNSITAGLVLAAVIMALSRLVSWLTFRSAKLERLLEGTPRLLIHHGRAVERNLARELVSAHELRARLRRQGVQRIEDVQEAILEADGTLSVIRRDEPPPN